MSKHSKYIKECLVCKQVVDMYPVPFRFWAYRGHTGEEFYCSYKCKTIADSKKNLQIKHK